jgi:ATP synthase F1 gamma subunit
LFSFFDAAVDTRAYKEVKLYFNYFENSISQIPARAHLFPFRKSSFDKFIDELNIDYLVQPSLGIKALLIEPDSAKYVAELRRQIRNYIISAAVIQNKTGEHAARMIAMKNAKDNATSFVKNLTL